MPQHYEQLPIFRKAMELNVFLEQAVRSFARFHRYEIGAELRRLAREIATGVIKANFAREKVPALIELRDKSEEMKLCLGIAREVKAFHSFKQFQRAAYLAADIARQSQGWLNSKRRKRPESPLAGDHGERA